jgi:hypothetical protein
MNPRGAALRQSTVREMANILLAAREDISPTTVSKNWPAAFIDRREELRSRYSKKNDYQRALNEDPKSLRAWFATVQRTTNENGWINLGRNHAPVALFWLGSQSRNEVRVETLNIWTSGYRVETAGQSFKCIQSLLLH